jgi:MYXO-CTERM domain-containing protein
MTRAFFSSAARRISLVSVALTLLAGTDPAHAQGRSSPVDARVRLLFEHRTRTGATAPLFVRAPEFESTGLAPLVARWKTTPTAAQRAKWAALGWREEKTRRSGAVRVLASKAAVEAMLADGVLASLSVDLPSPWIKRPLDEAATHIGLPGVAAAFRRASGGHALDGTGVVVGDIDGTADYYQPAFFKPLPPVPWIDVDGDGALTAGVDGVDVDGSGAVDPAEVLKLLPARGSSLFDDEGDLYGTDDPAFNPGWDYLWLDWNGDGRRNVGSEVPGAEQLPSLGEPVYAADDVDRDGSVRVPERVIPLGESKFRAIRVGSKTCRRGTNLTECKVTSSGQNGSHGTRMLGAVAGGQAGVSRFLGMAPAAELVLSVYGTEPLTDDLDFVLEEGADVVLTELGEYGTVAADGSTELELGLDAAVDDGVVAVSPAGNLGYSKKHAFATLPAASASRPYTNGVVLEDTAPQTAVAVTWREGDTDATGDFVLADGDVVDLSADVAAAQTASGRVYTVVHGTTPKGAGYLIFSISGALPATGNVLSLQSTGAKALTASLFVADALSAWSGGANFAQGDVDGCMNAPAFADKTLAVSAYALHTGAGFSPYPEDSGALRGFSGRGPDLWGDPAIDLASPDNSISAMAEKFASGLPEGLFANWKESGGTSGAGAIAAGLAALVVQANPGLAGLELRQKVLDAARGDAEVDKGNAAMWGAGKLGAGAGAPGTPPTVTLSAVAPAGAVSLTAAVVDDGDAGAIQARWDIGYDGTWDIDWTPGVTAETTIPGGASFLDVKVEVMDADGWLAAAVARVLPSEPELPAEPKDEDGGPGASQDDGCGCRVLGAGDGRGKAGGAAGLLVALVAFARRRRARPYGR